MPPKVKITKENIICAAVQLVRESGADALNARAVAAILGSSTQPIFSNYGSMDELKTDVVAFAKALSERYRSEDMASGRYPAYKASGMSYIRFAREEKELFKLLFMRDRSGEAKESNFDEIAPIIKIIMDSTGFDKQTASLLHLEMWVYVHGVASMTATGYLDMDDETVSRMLTDVYEGLKLRLGGKDERNG